MQVARHHLLRSLRCTLPCLIATFAAGAHAQGPAGAYPSRPIEIISPYATGGLSDDVMRPMAQYLSPRLGQPIIIQNRPGAAQQIGLEAGAKARPDGHTLVVASQAGLVLLTVSRKTLPYNPLRDFASITLMYETPLYLVVNPSVQARSVQELVALAKSQPGKLNYASVGKGSTHQFVMEMFKLRTGIDTVHVPFKGNPDAWTALVSGQVQVMFEGASVLPQVRSGALRALASSGLKRTRAMPDLPTVSEAGVPGFEMATWFGLAAPAGVPRPIIDRLNREVGDWLRLPATREKYTALNLDLTPSTPEEMTERIRSQIPIWSKVARAAGIDQE